MGKGLVESDHSSIQILVDRYGHLFSDGNKQAVNPARSYPIFAVPIGLSHLRTYTAIAVSDDIPRKLGMSWGAGSADERAAGMPRS